MPPWALDQLRAKGHQLTYEFWRPKNILKLHSIFYFVSQTKVDQFYVRNGEGLIQQHNILRLQDEKESREGQSISPQAEPGRERGSGGCTPGWTVRTGGKGLEWQLLLTFKSKWAIFLVCR